MKEEYLNELKEMENRLFDIINQSDKDVLYGKLGDTWNSLYEYLKEQGAINV